MSSDKVVPHLKLFPAIFYFQFLEQGKTHFESAKVWVNLNLFQPFWIIWIDLNWAKLRLGTVLAGPACQCPNVAIASLPLTPSHTQPMPTGPRCRPTPSISRARAGSPRAPPHVPARGPLSLPYFPLHVALNPRPLHLPPFLSAHTTKPP
jgi:hypothetical protein